MHTTGMLPPPTSYVPDLKIHPSGPSQSSPRAGFSYSALTRLAGGLHSQVVMAVCMDCFKVPLLLAVSDRVRCSLLKLSNDGIVTQSHACIVLNPGRLIVLS